MPRIRILSDHVANQIAAGEVIERPVAVVKELIENSLDAGSRRIEVEFRNGGKSYIRIEDDGCGMTPDDALLSLERHATSKIQEAADLMTVRSFGFRGEAVPSIASVSRFTLRTRSKERDHGCEVLVNGGKLIHRKDYGMSVGTHIEVANLFNSVPVRRKFMKTENTEAAHIIHLVRLYAVGHPEVAFTLIENGRLIFKSLISSKLIDRVSGVWNQKLGKELVELEAEEGGMRLWGLIGKPGVGRSTRQEIITFVNGRPVDSKTLSYALIESYHTYLPKGRYPVVFLFLEIDPEFVDVNVHPAKREVRFRNDALIRQFIITTILDCLKKLSQQTLQVKIDAREQAFPVLPVSLAVPILSPKTIVPLSFSAPLLNKPVFPDIPATKPQCNDIISVISEKGEFKVREETKRPTFAATTWRLIGGLRDVYGLFEAPAGLVIMNYKRAQQRVFYERIQKSFKTEGPCLSQPLLLPIPISLDPLTSVAFEDHLDILNKGGLRIVLFGRNFYRIEAVPSWLDSGLAEPFVKDVAALFREQGAISRAGDLLHEKIADLAVTHTLRFDTNFTDVHIDGLVQELLSCDNPLTCPRGMPTYFELSSGDLEKRFSGVF